MTRIELTSIAGSVVLSAVLVGTAFATPLVNGATIETRTFNDCPLSILTTINNYPTSIEITDVMHPACLGFANLHSFSLSEDGGTTAAVFDNNSNFHFAADFRIEGPGEGEGGLRISPWYGQFVDGRFMANAITGEIACFGGALPFYSFTTDHGLFYVKGTTIHLEVTYQANDLTAADPATIQYRVVSGGTTYDSPVLPFGQQNPNECDPYGLYGMLNDGRVGGYFQPRANTGESLTANWSDIAYSVLDDCECVDAAPPTIDVTVDRSVLWPPNHQYVEVCATVTASDDCDPAPEVSLLSVTSNESDNGGGDGDTEDDIVIGENNCFLLRSERAGGGDGRVYTITYCATDDEENTTCTSATVTVPHDQSGSAFASVGFTADGTAFEDGATTFALVILSAADFNARNVDASHALVGTHLGVVAPMAVEYHDADNDGLEDLRLYYETESVNGIRGEEGSTAAMRYQVGEGDFYLVSDIFALGMPIELQTSGVTSGSGGIAVMPPRPNPFRSSTVVQYAVGGTGGQVKIVVHDASGRVVRTLVDAVRTPGGYTAIWDGCSEGGARATAGVYFLRTDVAGRQTSDRLILLR